MAKYIYIIGFGDPETVKVGVSSNPCQRLRSVASHVGLKLGQCRLYVLPLQTDPYAIEKKCHNALSQYSTNGYGPDKKYPKETFGYGFEATKEMLENLIRETK